ncbi:glycosyltransferase family 61 protein [Asticcacaulis benevestitus]|uniref:Glycosyltransferase 61 catalytic domain-containing protein n=1 Tax=Asticcacaulis benevestitus DSM 16100 = ATCC BAA-896 TaxID=1121022 RepID=V4RGE1_9CAUL|nr:glycosyltransferase family 61 protein [Asticcacaulis benevestitus]ESQ90418.1 hypothetical protein ABENE_12575 [Asticcacaulis benevestitus DSM 16100 = ATCC BAA-896]
MARGRAEWKQALDIKPRLGKIFGGLEARAPSLTRAIRYYSLTETLPPGQSFEHTGRPMRLDQPVYAPTFKTLMVNNVESYNPGVAADAVMLDTAILENVRLVGHTLFPIRSETARIVSDKADSIPWGITYPSLSFKPPVPVAGLVTAIPRIKNYYHLMVDYVMPVMAALLRHPDRLSGPVTFVVNHDYPMLDVLIGTLREQGIEARLMKVGDGDTVMAARYLWAKSKAYHTEHAYAFRDELRLLSEAVARKTAHIKVPDKVFIPRSRTRLRNLLNQSELQAALATRGFAAWELEWSRPLEQIALFQRAGQIVSVHGAGLTNLMWGEGGHIVEIFPNDARKTTYLHMASQNGWTYDYVLGSDEAARQNFSVTVDEVLTKIG